MKPLFTLIIFSILLVGCGSSDTNTPAPIVPTVQPTEPAPPTPAINPENIKGNWSGIMEKTDGMPAVTNINVAESSVQFMFDPSNGNEIVNYSYNLNDFGRFSVTNTNQTLFTMRLLTDDTFELRSAGTNKVYVFSREAETIDAPRPPTESDSVQATEITQ